jgi:hypothetical protein
MLVPPVNEKWAKAYCPGHVTRDYAHNVAYGWLEVVDRTSAPKFLYQIATLFAYFPTTTLH